MRWIYLTVVVVFAVAVVIFLLQNRDLVTLAFLGASIRAPVAIIIAGFYLIGAITGGSLFALLRRSYEGARRVG